MTLAIRDGHVIDTPARELTDMEQIGIAVDLLTDHGIHVVPVVSVADGWLHLWAQHEMSTLQEVTAIGAYRARTDCPLAWHKAAAS